MLGTIARGHNDADNDDDEDEDDDDPFHLSSYISQRSIPSIDPSIYTYIHP